MRISKITFLILTLISVQSVLAQGKRWTLRECIDYALENNISIQQSKLDEESAQLDQLRARGNFLPGVNASARHSWNVGLTENVTTGTLQNITTQNSSMGVSAGVDLFTGLRNLNTLHRSNLSVLANHYQIGAMKDDISLFVANSYLQILFNVETLKVLQLQSEVNQKEIVRTQELIALGQLPQGEIYQLEAIAASLNQQMIVAENNLRLSKISLAQTLLLEDYYNFDIVVEEMELPDSEVMQMKASEIYEAALKNRNDVKASLTNIDIAQKEYKIATGGRLPTLSAFYQFSTGATSIIDISYGEQFRSNRGHIFGLSLSVPIFNRFANDVNIEKSKVFLEKAKLNLMSTKIDLENQVHQAYYDARGAFVAFEAAQTTVEAREAATDYARERFEAGVINSFDFTQVKQDQTTSESDLIRSKYDYIFKLKVLEFYFGLPVHNLND
ncbi:TolC family protein [Marinoscillum sp. MHG1-6]|uniref:TolC family protein n=1 Tax=Marinoscillum sp. MHG1-6 TaxID=2959627 RepID=UPI0021575E1B|nr:TolC family protein [Marinoscillum sp. MHG1-6]